MAGLIILSSSGLVLTMAGWWQLHLYEGTRFPGWLLLWFGGWLLFASSTAYIPLWVPLTVAVGSFLIWRVWRRRDPEASFLAIGHVIALLGIGLMGVATTTEVNAPLFVAVYPVFLLTSLVGSYLALEMDALPWVPFVVVALVGGVLLGPTGLRSLARPDSMGRLGNTVWQSRLLFLGLSPAQQGRPVTLDNGSRAWVSWPDVDGPVPAALILHGNDNDASQQASALVLHRALLKAGYLVMALDHLGYGETPLPSLAAPLEDWDPQGGRLAAYDWLAARENVREIVLVGHSMGADGVWRLAAERDEVSRIYLFGASLAAEQPLRTSAKVEWDEFAGEYERFHQKRGLTGRIDPDQYLAIIATYYGTPLAMIEGGPSITFVAFATEWPDIVASRDQLYATLPEPKGQYPFPTNHYFSATDWRGLMAGDTRAVSELVTLFSEGR